MVVHAVENSFPFFIKLVKDKDLKGREGSMIM